MVTTTCCWYDVQSVPLPVEFDGFDQDVVNAAVALEAHEDE